jgi:hypothetical protein
MNGVPGDLSAKIRVHQGLQGFFDVHRFRARLPHGIGLELKQPDIGA